MENLRYKFGIFKNGFTLAEVLITLVIIGVVAALTIPTAIAKYQKTQTPIRLKKAYSTFAQAVTRAVAEYGSIESWELGADRTAQAADDFFDKYLKPYLRVDKDCMHSTSGVCDFHYCFLDGTNCASLDSRYKRFYISDGTMIAMLIINQSDTKQVSTIIDINGTKGPNLQGKDVFQFSYYILSSADATGKFIPYYGYGLSVDTLLNSTTSGSCNKSAVYQAGLGCPAVIMMSGWKLPDNYPW